VRSDSLQHFSSIQFLVVVVSFLRLSSPFLFLTNPSANFRQYFRFPFSFIYIPNWRSMTEWGLFCAPPPISGLSSGLPR